MLITEGNCSTKFQIFKKSLETIIKDKTIKSSLEAKVTLCAGGDKLAFLKKAENGADPRL